MLLASVDSSGLVLCLEAHGPAGVRVQSHGQSCDDQEGDAAKCTPASAGADSISGKDHCATCRGGGCRDIPLPSLEKALPPSMPQDKRGAAHSANALQTPAAHADAGRHPVCRTAALLNPPPSPPIPARGIDILQC